MVSLVMALEITTMPVKMIRMTLTIDTDTPRSLGEATSNGGDVGLMSDILSMQQPRDATEFSLSGHQSRSNIAEKMVCITEVVLLAFRTLEDTSDKHQTSKRPCHATVSPKAQPKGFYSKGKKIPRQKRTKT